MGLLSLLLHEGGEGNPGGVSREGPALLPSLRPPQLPSRGTCLNVVVSELLAKIPASPKVQQGDLQRRQC